MSEQQPIRDNVTIFDVAEEAGVSYSTVSRVVNNYPYVKPQTRQRVQTAMKKLGYVPNIKARSLAGGRSQTLGVLLYDFESSYHVELVRGIDAEMATLDYDLMLYTTHFRGRKESSMVAKLTQGLVDGLLIVLPQNLDEYLADLDSRQFPYILIDHSPLGDASNTISANNWKGSFEATNYLIDLGHQRIGFVNGAIISGGSASERLAGYMAALEKHGLAVDQTNIMPGDFSRESGYEAAEQFMTLPHPPTAVVASCDACAFGVIEALLAHNVRVPEDISVMGFDDLPEAKTTRPSLTTMRQDLRQMGRIAAQRLIEYLEEPNHPHTHVELPMELIVRESTCSPENSKFAAP